MRRAKVSDVVREKPEGTSAMGRILGSGAGVLIMSVLGSVEGAVVMYLEISLDLLCHCEMIERYSTKLSISSVVSAGFGITAAVEASNISVSEDGVVAGLTGAGEAVVPHTLTAKDGSLLRYSLMKDPISLKSSLSAPSTAITAPLTSKVGLLGPGGDSGGEILEVNEATRP